jgi:hypothetical protein
MVAEVTSDILYDVTYDMESQHQWVVALFCIGNTLVLHVLFIRIYDERNNQESRGL